MGDLSNTISTISALLFIASTAVNIYLTMRLSKFENSMNKYIDDKIKAATISIDADIREAKGDIKSQVMREVEILTDRLDRMDRKT
jgi:hypothetical protein